MPDMVQYDDKRRGLIPEDLLKFRWLDELALDPTGQVVAYTVRRPDVPTNGYASHVYLRRLDQAEGERHTTSDGQASSLAWSRDGTRVAYAWSEEGRNSVRVLHIESGVEREYPLDGEGFSGLDWSADGTKLAGVRWTHQRHPDDQGPRPGIPAPTIRVVRRLRYKQDGPGWVHDRFMQIWILEVGSGELHQVTTSECDYFEPKWSQRGERLAFIAHAREQNVEMGQGHIFIYDHASGAPYPLLPNWIGACRSPVWGEDDRSIAFAGHTNPVPTNRRIFMVPFLADVEARTARRLSPEIEDEVGNYGVADQRKGLTNITMKWPEGDPWIYFLLTLQGAAHLYRINTEGQYECLVEGPSMTFEYSPIAGGRVAYGQADPSNPGDLYLLENGQSRRLTMLNTWLRDHKLAVPEEYWYEGLDGAKVHAWIMTPADLDPTKKYPTIVYVHCSMFSWDFNHEVQCYNTLGYVVAYFNQRGTTAGYGQAWTRASEGDQGGAEYVETMLGVDDLITRPYVDSERLGVTGGSCGGFMTNWIVGHTDRFKAAVTQRSISNDISFCGTSDLGPEYTRGEAGTDPWSDLEGTWRQSPLAYIDRVNTPLLIEHSTEDHRCPLEQAEQLFAALRWRGKEVEMVIYEGENHGLSRGGRPGNRIERVHRIAGWFQKYLGTQPLEIEASINAERARA